MYMYIKTDCYWKCVKKKPVYLSSSSHAKCDISTPLLFAPLTDLANIFGSTTAFNFDWLRGNFFAQSRHTHQSNMLLTVIIAHDKWGVQTVAEHWRKKSHRGKFSDTFGDNKQLAEVFNYVPRHQDGLSYHVISERCNKLDKLIIGYHFWIVIMFLAIRLSREQKQTHR